MTALMGSYPQFDSLDHVLKAVRVSPEAWLEDLRKKADAPEALAETVSSQVAAHKLDKLKG